MEDFQHNLSETPTKVVLALTGGGFEALGDIGRFGGLSQTLISAYQPYHPAEMERFLGFKPKKAVSDEIAQQLAMTAYQLARKAEPDSPVVGIGCTSVLARAAWEEERENRVHKIILALQFPAKTETWILELKARRSRKQEERINADLIINAVLYACGLEEFSMIIQSTEEIIKTTTFWNSFETAYTNVYQVIHRLKPYCIINPTKPALIAPKALLSGSFNPYHDGHHKMCLKAEEILKTDVHYEMPIQNADKAPLNYSSLMERIKSFGQSSRQLFLTNAATFVEKATLFPNCHFLIGIDTADRIIHPRFYHDSETLMREALEEINSKNCKFLVFPRVKDGKVRKLNIDYPDYFLKMAIGLDDFREDVSSTEIRGEE